MAQAEQGNASAQNILGHMYYNGDGVLKVCMDKNNQHFLDLPLCVTYEFGGYGVLQDYTEALKWYHKAENKERMAEFRLGCMYQHGLGVIKDGEKAKQFFETAFQALSDKKERLSLNYWDYYILGMMYSQSNET